MSNLSNIFKGKTEQEIANDLAKLHPIERFSIQFVRLYTENPDPSQCINIIQLCEPDPRLKWTIQKEEEAEFYHRNESHRIYNPDPTYNLYLEYETTFDKYSRTIQFRHGQCQIWGDIDVRSIQAENRSWLPNLDY